MKSTTTVSELADRAKQCNTWFYHTLSPGATPPWGWGWWGSIAHKNKVIDAAYSTKQCGPSNCTTRVKPPQIRTAFKDANIYHARSRDTMCVCCCCHLQLRNLLKQKCDVRHLSQNTHTHGRNNSHLTSGVGVSAVISTQGSITL